MFGPAGFSQKTNVVEDVVGVKSGLVKGDGAILDGRFADGRCAGVSLVLGGDLVEDGNQELLKSRRGGVVDDDILARLQHKANVERGNEEVARDVAGVELEKGWQGLEDAQLDVKAARRGFSECLEDLVESRSRDAFCGDESLEADDGDAREFDGARAAGNDEGVYEVGMLGEF